MKISEVVNSGIVLLECTEREARQIASVLCFHADEQRKIADESRGVNLSYIVSGYQELDGWAKEIFEKVGY